MTKSGECEVPGVEYSSLRLSLSPPAHHGDSGQMLSVDGEDFEAVPIQLILRNNYISIFT